MPYAHAVYASVLVRGGRDKEAVTEYKTALDYLSHAAEDTDTTMSQEEFDIRMGLGKSYQRMLLYYEATDTFLHKRMTQYKVPGQSEALLRAATCCMRLGLT